MINNILNSKDSENMFQEIGVILNKTIQENIRGIKKKESITENENNILLKFQYLKSLLKDREIFKNNEIFKNFINENLNNILDYQRDLLSQNKLTEKNQINTNSLNANQNLNRKNNLHTNNQNLNPKNNSRNVDKNSIIQKKYTIYQVINDNELAEDKNYEEITIKRQSLDKDNSNEWKQLNCIVHTLDLLDLKKKFFQDNKQRNDLYLFNEKDKTFHKIENLNDVQKANSSYFENQTTKNKQNNSGHQDKEKNSGKEEKSGFAKFFLGNKNNQHYHGPRRTIIDVIKQFGKNNYSKDNSGPFR